MYRKDVGDNHLLVFYVITSSLLSIRSFIERKIIAMKYCFPVLSFDPTILFQDAVSHFRKKCVCVCSKLSAKVILLTIEFILRDSAYYKNTNRVTQYQK